MAGSTPPGTLQPDPYRDRHEGRTPGPLGHRDAADPLEPAAPADTPGPVGTSSDAAHAADPTRPAAAADAKEPASIKSAPIQKRAALFFKPEESATFKKLWETGVAMRVRIAALPTMKAEDAGFYDPLQNAIFLSPAEYRAPADPTHTRRSTAHELYHAWTNREVLRKAHDPESRKALIDAEMLALTEEQYVKQASAEERRAEGYAWMCDFEARDFFERKRGGTGFERKFMLGIARERIEEFWGAKKKFYVERARQRWRAAQDRHTAKP
jgi:hypothetical protein